MRIQSLRIQNYRTVEDITLHFPRHYAALCGRNDAGKTNVFRVLRIMFQQTRPFFPSYVESLSVKDDFPKWLQKEKTEERFIEFQASLQISRADDEGLFRFLLEYVKEIESDDTRPLDLTITTRFTAEQLLSYSVSISGRKIEELKSQEIVNKLRSSFAVMFHDSTESFRFRLLENTGLFEDTSGQDAQRIAEAKERFNKVLSRVAKRSQEEMSQLLGRLKDKYILGLSVPSFDTSEMPYNITLGNEQQMDVDLDRWGSGTQNRTHILMTLFRAKRVRESAISASKITPIIVIEEPESYLHPSAQGEFGEILRDLAEEFKVQVIVATHSPFMLSLVEPEANLLLERQMYRNKPRQTKLVETGGASWMEPFSLALGLSGRELAPWREALFTNTDAVLLVEGETDKEYMQLLLDESHGEHQLKFKGEIFAYGGKDTLRQKQLLRFIRSKFKCFIVTYDLDVEAEVQPNLEDIGLLKGRDYIGIGRDLPGKTKIEGLIPDPIFQSVFSTNVELVQRATAGTPAEQKSAKSLLKRFYLEEFKKTAKPGNDSYKLFYPLVKLLNKMIAEHLGVPKKAAAQA